ncbi:uncharacterized protein LOC144085795 isoform X2 [Stigmatopora argus]
MKAITVKMTAMLLMMLTAVGEALPLRDEDADQDSLARRGSLPLPRMSWLMFQENAGAGGGSRRSPKGPPRPRGPRRNPQQLPSPGASRSDLCSRRPPRASFMGRLHRTLEVGRGDREELRRFAQDSPPSRRGLEVGDGRYVVAHTGVYLLAARLSLQLGEVELRLGESVRAAICLKSLCDSGRVGSGRSRRGWSLQHQSDWNALHTGRRVRVGLRGQ